MTDINIRRLLARIDSGHHFHDKIPIYFFLLNMKENDARIVCLTLYGESRECNLGYKFNTPYNFKKIVEYRKMYKRIYSNLIMVDGNGCINGNTAL